MASPGCEDAENHGLFCSSGSSDNHHPHPHPHLFVVADKGSHNRREDRKLDEAHFSRLEQILGGKSRKFVENPDDDRSSETDKLEGSDKVDNFDDHHGNMLDEHGPIVDGTHYNDLSLEVAMKELMEATHEALVNMKGEIVRLQYDLERALMEISLLRQREELLQHQLKDKAAELEKEFMRRIDEMQKTMILQLNLCKQECEQIMLARLESVLDRVKDFKSINNGIAGAFAIPLEVRRSISGCHEELNSRCQHLIQSSHNDNMGLKVRPLIEQKVALTEEMLQNINPKRLEQSVATVRGWLQSPTPSESSSFANTDMQKMCSTKRRLSTLPMPTLVSSLKEEAKWFAMHRRASTPGGTRTSELMYEPNCLIKSSITKQQPSNAFLEDKKSSSSVSVLDDVQQGSENIPSITVPETQKENSSRLWGDHGSYIEGSFCSQKEHHANRHFAPSDNADSQHPSLLLTALPSKSKLAKSVQENRPALRILKPSNIKIADFLISDSEEDGVS